MISIDGDTSKLSCFEWQDIYYAIKEFKEIRVKNKVPKHTYQSNTGLSIELSITPAKHIHVNWCNNEAINNTTAKS